MRYFHHKFKCNFIATCLLMHENDCCYTLRVFYSNWNWNEKQQITASMPTKNRYIMNSLFLHLWNKLWNRCIVSHWITVWKGAFINCVLVAFAWFILFAAINHVKMYNNYIYFHIVSYNGIDPNATIRKSTTNDNYILV